MAAGSTGWRAAVTRRRRQDPPGSDAGSGGDEAGNDLLDVRQAFGGVVEVDPRLVVEHDREDKAQQRVRYGARGGRRHGGTDLEERADDVAGSSEHRTHAIA